MEYNAEKIAAGKLRATKRKTDVSFDLDTHLQNIPMCYHDRVRKHFTSTSLKGKIFLRCMDCGCWSMNEVRYCTVNNCGLWQVRPYQ